MNTMRRCLLGTHMAVILQGGLFAAAYVGPGVPASAQAQPQTFSFDIPAQDLGDALRSFAHASRQQVVFEDAAVRGKSAPALRGSHTAEAALDLLLEGSGLQVEKGASGLFIVHPSDSARQGRAPAAGATTLGEISVTGTRIRGGSTPSPVVAIGAERIREEGFNDLGEVIRSVPQNFTGGQNPGVLMGNMAGAGLANQNVTGGSGLNLRGLGPDASLTLLSGRRLSYSGFVQAVDISAIPVDAVERIEIVVDGASAIYGSDAVGGVGNVILRRGFDGVRVGARYAATADGGLTTREITATAGTTWATGGLLATYKASSTDPIYTRQRRYTQHLFEPSTIYPDGKLRSGLFSAYQALGDTVELRVDALRTEREQFYNYYLSSPLLYYITANETASTLVSPGIEVSLPHDWTLSIGGTWGRDEVPNNFSRVDALTGVVSLYASDCFCNTSRSYDAGAEGPLFGMGGGDARLAVGVGYRMNDFNHVSYIPGTSDYLPGSIANQGRENSRSAYAEIHLPFVGREMDIAGVQRLEATAAVRSEDYDSFGRVTTPKLGIIYGPGADFTLKASWGKSFKVPTLFQRRYGVFAALLNPQAYGGIGYAPDETLFFVSGGNPDLQPERARTWTASLAFHPEALPGLEADLAWFDIDYTDRVVQPINNYSEALSNPNYVEFVDYAASASRQAELLALARSFSNGTGAPYVPDNVIAILDARFVNATRQRIKGLDLSGSYRFDLGAGRMTVRGSASWLDSEQQTQGMPSPYALAGTLHNPARLNGRMGAAWNQGGLSLSAFANYASGVTNTRDGRKNASFTTFDATLPYDTGDAGGVWSGVELALSAQNLLDRAPPLYVPSNLYVPPYDSTNYSAIGRLLSLSVSKRW